MPISRDVSGSILAKLHELIKDPEYRVLLLLDEPGSGKTAILKRLGYELAKVERNVFLYTGNELIDEKNCAKILDAIPGPCYVFVDDWADHASFFQRVLSELKRTDILLIGTERKYRRPYIENSLADESIAIVESQLDLDASETRRLIRKFHDQGLSSIGPIDQGQLNDLAKNFSGNAISVAACRIQNNFQAFDRIVSKILSECGNEEIKAYVTVGLARFCYSGGVKRTILYDAQPSKVIERMFDIYSRLPIVFSDSAKQYVVPARSVTADRVISILHSKDASSLTCVFINLANAVAPYVNRDEIRKRAPSAKLAGSLMDFDRLVRRFINDHAEHFYDGIKERWDWNSRYWEQCALMKLDRYLIDKVDRRLLEEGIQNARHAYSIEKHPLSLTTLAKLLFSALDHSSKVQIDLFEEGWELINQSIDIEANWASVKATAFVVCFNGALTFVRKGGLLTGAQAERLRDVIAITHKRRLRAPQLVKLREQVIAEVL